MKRCICFSRVSSYAQDLKAQQVAVKEAALKEYTESEILEVSGKESAIKLAEMERQTLNEMKVMVEDNPTIESIYFFAVDRLARRVSVVMSIKEWADEHHINLVFLNPYPFSTWFKNTDGVWKKNDISDIYLMFLGFGAKMEMEIKNERFAAAKKLMKENGQATTKLAFGYKKGEDKRIEIDEEKARIIHWIFDAYLNKEMSCGQIWDEAVMLGYLPNKYKIANKSKRILNIIKNKMYSGAPSPKGLIYPIIIDKEVQDAAIKLASERKFKAKVYTKTTFYCKSIIKDITSNTIMIPHPNHNVYKATNGDNYGINLNVADSLIWRTAFECKWNLLSVERSDDQINKTKNELKEVSTKIVNLKKQGETFNELFDKAYEAYITSGGRISKDKYDETIKKIDADKKELEKKIHQYEKREIEIGNVLEELKTKREKDISIYTLKNITDDNERMNIIKECITGMTCKKFPNKWIYVEVHHLMYSSPNRYLYIPHGGTRKELYWLNCKFDINTFNVEEAIKNGEAIDISNEVERRFRRRK